MWRNRMNRGVAKPTALRKATDLLARQDHSEKRLREKLARQGYDGDEIDEAIDRLKGCHYLDDERACGHQFGYLYENSSMSQRQIVQKLAARGFSIDTINNEARDEEESRERELNAARKAFNQKFGRAELPEDEGEQYKTMEKMKAFLYRRGFDLDICETVYSEWVDRMRLIRTESMI